jgi:ATP-dependent RNA helicase DDX10/DBP4
VLQLDCPEDAKTYLHRVGRTARHSSVGQSLLTLLPSEETGMIKQLKIHKIPIDKIQVDPRKLVNMQRKIEAHLASDVELKSSAQRAFQSYLKSTYLLKNKDVFDVLKLDTDKFAISLGLAIPPRVRFLQKQLKLKQGRGHAQADEQKKVSLDLDSDESDSDQDDMLQIKRKDHNIEDDDNKASEDDLEAAELDLEKKVKIVTKAQAAKKTLKKNQTPNQKILFNEEGQGQEQGLTLKASVEGQAYDHEEVGQGGIDLEKVKKVLKAEDKFDKQVDKEKRKTKKREERMKSKAKSKRNGEGKGDDDDFAEESDDDSEGPNLDWLPDPDKIYGSKHQEDQSDQEESSSEDENPGYVDQ